jgi:Holliday junction resolvase
MHEKKLQSEIIKWLKSQGAYVIKTSPGAGIPNGCPDIIFLKEGFWGAIEVKKSNTVKFQPLQEVTIMKLQDWSYCRVVYPQNWETIKSELETMLA